MRSKDIVQDKKSPAFKKYSNTISSVVFDIREWGALLKHEKITNSGAKDVPLSGIKNDLYMKKCYLFRNKS
jgi:hypothetical protein